MGQYWLEDRKSHMESKVDFRNDPQLTASNLQSTTNEIASRFLPQNLI